MASPFMIAGPPVRDAWAPPLTPRYSDLFCTDVCDGIPLSPAHHIPDNGNEPCDSTPSSASTSAGNSPSPNSSCATIASPGSLAADPDFAAGAARLRGLFGNDDLIDSVQTTIATSFAKDQPFTLNIKGVVVDKTQMAHYKTCRYLPKDRPKADVSIEEFCALPHCPYCLPDKYDGISLTISNSHVAAQRTAHVQYESFMRIAAMEMAYYRQELEALKSQLSTLHTPPDAVVNNNNKRQRVAIDPKD